MSLEKYATPGERETARRFVAACLSRGFLVSVCDGEEWTVKQSKDAAQILDAMASTDADTLRVRDSNGDNLGFALFVWGNAPDGSELIADYADRDTMRALVAESEAR